MSEMVWLLEWIDDTGRGAVWGVYSSHANAEKAREMVSRNIPDAEWSISGKTLDVELQPVVPGKP